MPNKNTDTPAPIMPKPIKYLRQALVVLTPPDATATTHLKFTRSPIAPLTNNPATSESQQPNSNKQYRLRMQTKRCYPTPQDKTLFRSETTHTPPLDDR